MLVISELDCKVPPANNRVGRDIVKRVNKHLTEAELIDFCLKKQKMSLTINLKINLFSYKNKIQRKYHSGEIYILLMNKI